MLRVVSTSMLTKQVGMDPTPQVAIEISLISNHILFDHKMTAMDVWASLAQVVKDTSVHPASTGNVRAG